MKRRLMGRELIEVNEEITASGNWTPPAGCKSVDVFVVGGGGNGGNGSPYGSGSGGNGGECKTFMAIPVVQGAPVAVVVGSANNNSSFGAYTAKGAAGVKGGAALGQVCQNGNKGGDGIYAFNNSSRFPRKYGAGGGGGAAYAWGNPNDRYTGGYGGNYGAGTGGDSYSNASAPKAADATWYGAGGGGGGKSDNNQTTGGCGLGYQGIVILHYWKYK